MPRHLLTGALNSLSFLAVVLTLGLLAFAPLGHSAAQAGIAAAFATVIAGGLVFAWRSSSATPVGGASSATALILASLVAQLARDPQLDLATPSGLSALVAVAASSVMLMGLLQILMSLLGLGRLARFVPQPVLAGFMNGVALMILVSQLPPLLGLPPATRLGDVSVGSQVQAVALAVGLATAATVWLLRWRWPHAPASLLALVLGTVLYQLLAASLTGVPQDLTLGALPQGWVLPRALRTLTAAPAHTLLQRHAGAVLSTALVLALIGSLESLLVALALDQLTHTRHNPRRELLALGLANLASGACGGLALVLSRTGATPLAQAGARGRRPVMAMVSVFVLLYAFSEPWLAYLPKAALAGIMLTIAVALLDRWTQQLLRQLRTGERSAELWRTLAMVAAVCAVTVGWGFVAGVLAGVLMSMLVFIHSMNRSLLRSRCSAAERPSRRLYGPAQEALLRGLRARVTLFELEGALFFGNAERLAVEAHALDADCCCLILELRRVSTIDESGAMLLQQLSSQLAQRGVRLLLAGVAAGNAHGQRLRAFGCFRDSPRPDWWPDADRALEAAERLLLTEAGSTQAQATVPLAQCTLLHQLKPAQLAQMQALLQEQRLPAGTLLFREGDPGDALYLLTQGSISIIGGSSEPRQRFVSFSPGVMLGEMTLLDAGRRSADAVADSDSVVFVLTRQAFDTLTADDPVLGACLMRNIAFHLSERLRSAASAWRQSAA